MSRTGGCYSRLMIVGFIQIVSSMNVAEWVGLGAAIRLLIATEYGMVCHFIVPLTERGVYSQLAWLVLHNEISDLRAK